MNKPIKISFKKMVYIFLALSSISFSAKSYGMCHDPYQEQARKNYLRAQKIWKEIKDQAEEGRFDTFDAEEKAQRKVEKTEIKREKEKQAINDEKVHKIEYENKLKDAR